jgi:hypothetical protein
MKAVIPYDKNASVSCRVFDPASASWWTGSAWSQVEAQAALTALIRVPLSDPYVDTYSGSVAVPAGTGLIVEYINADTGEWLNSDPATPAAIPADLTAIAGALAAVKAQTDRLKFTASDQVDANASFTVDTDSIVRALAATLGAGTGDTAVNHHTGGVDNLRFLDSQGASVGNGGIAAYLKDDYDAGLVSLPFVRGVSRTRDDGRWQWPLMLNTGFTYTVVMRKSGHVRPTAVEVTV